MKTEFHLVQSEKEPKGLIGLIQKDIPEGIYFESRTKNVFSLWEDGDILESEFFVYDPKLHRRVRITGITMEAID